MAAGSCVPRSYNREGDTNAEHPRYPVRKTVDLGTAKVVHREAPCPEGTQGVDAEACQLRILDKKILEQVEEIFERATRDGVFTVVAGNGDLRLEELHLARTDWSDLNLKMDASLNISGNNTTGGAKAGMSFNGFWADYEFTFRFINTRTNQVFVKTLPDKYRFFPFFSLEAHQDMTIPLDKLVGSATKLPPALVDALLGLSISFEFHSGFRYRATNLLPPDLSRRDNVGITKFQYDVMKHLIVDLCQVYIQQENLPAQENVSGGTARACALTSLPASEPVPYREKVEQVVNERYRLMKVVSCAQKNRTRNELPLFEITFVTHELWRLQPGSKLWAYDLNAQTLSEWVRFGGANNWLTVTDLDLPANRCGTLRAGEKCASAELGRLLFFGRCNELRGGTPSAADLKAHKTRTTWMGLSPTDAAAIPWLHPELRD